MLGFNCDVSLLRIMYVSWPYITVVCQDLSLAFAKMIEDVDVTEESYGLGKTKIFLK